MEALRNANEEQARQIAELKRQLANNPQDTERITQEFADADKIFLSNQKSDEGWKLWEQKDFNGAKNVFDEAVKLNPDNARAYFGQGTSYNSLKQYELGIQDLSKAIEINPNIHSNAYNNRGWTYYCMKNYQQAIKDFEKALEITPNHAKAKNNREACLKAMNK